MKRKCSKKEEKPRLCLIAVFTAAVVLFGTTALHAAGFERYPGDVNVDRQIDVADGVLLARYCVEDQTVVITDEGIANADANNDHEINPHDTTCVLQMIAGQIPMPKNPYASETSPDTDDPEMTAPPAETVPETTEVVTEITEPPVETETTTVPEQPLSGDVLTADQTDYPLGVSVSVLSRNAQPDETLTVQYQEGNIIFAVYAAEPKKTMIAFAHSDDIFGYYIFCSEYTAPAGYEVTEMRDKLLDDKLYAVLVQKDGLSIAFPNLANGNETQVLSKLAYYATNGLRAINGLDGYIWDEELAKAAMLHSKDMAENDFCAHNSSDGTKFSDRLLNFGIDWQSCAENVDYGYLDPFSAVNGWYNSTSGHRKNLLHTDYQRIGIAFAYNSESAHHYYGTQDFYRGWE